MSESDFLARLFRDAERRAPGSDEISRRIASLCGLNPTTKVLDLGCGAGPTARLLAREFGCEVTCVDLDPAALETLTASARKEGCEARIKPVLADMRSVELPPASFEAVLAEGSARHLGPTLKDAAAAVRKFLRPHGRVAFTATARVGRSLPSVVEAFYRDRGESLLFPRELSAQVEQAGFEPLALEAFADAIVDEHYRFVEKALAQLGAEADEHSAALRKEIDVFRREGGRQAVNVVLVVARRRDPGERPPAPRGSD